MRFSESFYGFFAQCSIHITSQNNLEVRPRGREGGFRASIPRGVEERCNFRGPLLFGRSSTLPSFDLTHRGSVNIFRAICPPSLFPEVAPTSNCPLTRNHISSANTEEEKYRLKSSYEKSIVRRAKCTSPAIACIFFRDRCFQRLLWNSPRARAHGHFTVETKVTNRRREGSPIDIGGTGFVRASKWDSASLSLSLSSPISIALPLRMRRRVVVVEVGSTHGLGMGNTSTVRFQLPKYLTQLKTTSPISKSITYWATFWAPAFHLKSFPIAKPTLLGPVLRVRRSVGPIIKRAPLSVLTHGLK